MWVKLKTIKQISKKGATKTYRPGDAVDVGKHLALRWIADGDAVALDPSRVGSVIAPDSGVVSWGYSGQPFPSELNGSIPLKLETTEDEWPDLAYPLTMLYRRGGPFRASLIPVGFSLLSTWQVACPVADYDILTENIGTANEQQATLDVIRDLRVPVYDIRLMFVRRSSDTRRLISLWRDEMQRFMDGEPALAFLRALYTVKPLILALPLTWMTAGGQDPYEP